MKDLEYRKKQLKQLQNQVIDLEDIEGNISITDLTFNDFKIDLDKSTDEELIELTLSRDDYRSDIQPYLWP